MNETPTTYLSTYGVDNTTVSGIHNLLASTTATAASPFNIDKENNMAKATRRIVRVIISDSNEDISLEHTVLYDSGELTTEQTNQELYFELDMKGLLETHNVYRTTCVDSEYPESTVYLEPARIRDLNMTVITIAGL